MTANTVTTKPALQSLTNSILKDLNSLEDGWLGVDSIAPSSETICDAERLLKALNLKSKEYLEVCVDEDGKITFFWWFDADDLLSIDIIGSGKAVCTHTPENTKDIKFGVFDVNDHVAIANFTDPISVHIKSSRNYC